MTTPEKRRFGQQRQQRTSAIANAARRRVTGTGLSAAAQAGPSTNPAAKRAGLITTPLTPAKAAQGALNNNTATIPPTTLPPASLPKKKV